MWIYRNARWGFEVTFPDGWREYGLIRRLLRHYDSSQPEFVGPKGTDIKFAIGSISPVPTLKEMQRNLEAIAERHGHWVVDIQSITVYGKDHATIVYHVPLEPLKPATDPLSRLRGMVSGRTLRLKNYHLVLGQTEYVVTSKIALFDGPIGHVGGRPVQEMSILYAYNEDYDDIVRTFRLVADSTH